MKTDDDVETMLRRYRPRAPSSGLRLRCSALPHDARWPYAAAAALLLMAMGVYAANGTLQPRGAPPRSDAAIAARVAEVLGGGPDAERLAAAALARFHADELSRRLDAAVPSAARPGEPSR